MIIHYSILFTLDLLHEYFADGRTTAIDIVPAPETEMLFKGVPVLWRKSKDRYFALIKATDKGSHVYTPFINTPPDEVYRSSYGKNVFRFYLLLQQPEFLNYTDVNLQAATGSKYYFSNMAGNKRNGVLYLSLPVPLHTNGKEYLPGDLVQEPATDNVFEAIAKHTSTAAAQLTDASLWAPKGLRFLARPLKSFTVGKQYHQGEVVANGINVFEAVQTHTATNNAELADPLLWKSRGQGQLQYPTPNDLVVNSSGRFVFTLPAPVSKADISFFKFNYDVTTPAYNVPVGAPVTQEYEVPQSQVVVDLSPLNPGKYVVTINSETQTVYYDPHMSGSNILGVLEVFNHLPGSNDYSFLTANEEIRPASYVLQFPFRRVLWKYIRKDSTAQTITDTGTTAYSFTIHGDDFISNVPIPLAEEAVDTLELDFNNADFKLFPLPNPPVHRLKRCTQNGYDYLCSELFLNY